MEYRTLLADAVAYWERKRLIYNAVLAVLVVVCWGADLLATEPVQLLGAALVLLFFAGIANALYCLAYPIDLGFQMTSLRQPWRQHRNWLFLAGMIVASSLALWIMLGSGMG